jgi:hypothetical protein
MINWVPDAIPISFPSFLSNFYNSLVVWNYFSNLKLLEESDEYYTVYGYSCRSLFETVLKAIHNDNYSYAITPIHHTSFKNIIESVIEDKNIKVLDLNMLYNTILEHDLEGVKIVIISHLFGQDLDLNYINEQKKKHNFLVIEDRVQGGSINKPFSHECIDISFYSMGMDKRPVSLGGGYVNIRKDLSNLCHTVVREIDNMKQESNLERFISLLKKIPTFILYNYSSVFYLSSSILNIFGISTIHAISTYRKKNPGFEHNNYMMKPSAALLKSMKNNKNNYKKIEHTLQKKYNLFYDKLGHHIFMRHFPWKVNIPLTMYNTIFVSKKKNSEFQVKLLKNRIPFINNPTWKVLNCASNKYQEFCNGIYYLPCLYHMNSDEISELRNVISEI